MAAKKTAKKKAPAAKAKQPAGKAKASKMPALAAPTPAKKPSQIEAALQGLAKAGEPMNCQAMVEAMAAQGLWQSPGGKTPAGTLYASILRDLAKGKDARFKKVERGQFALAGRK